MLCCQAFTDDSLEFQRRISQRNGLSEETYLPPALHTQVRMRPGFRPRDSTCTRAARPDMTGNASACPAGTKASRPCIRHVLLTCVIPVQPPLVNMENAREEARMVLFGAVEDVLKRTGAPLHPMSLIQYIPHAAGPCWYGGEAALGAPSRALISTCLRHVQVSVLYEHCNALNQRHCCMYVPASLKS